MPLGFYREIFAHCRPPVVVVPEFVQVVAPPEALSLFGAALPGQQVLTLNLLGQTLVKTAPPPGTQCRVSLSPFHFIAYFYFDARCVTYLSAGLASAPLNIPNLTNQPLHLTALPSLPTSNIYSSPASLTITNLTGNHRPVDSLTDRLKYQTN